MHRETWKRFERELARDVGTLRVPVSGRDAHEADFIAGPYCYQAKYRKIIPSWLFDWLAGICGTAGKDRVGVLVLNQPGKKRSESIVCLRWADWVDIVGTPKEGK